VILATVPPPWAVAIRTAIGAVALIILALATRRLARPPRADLPVLVSITVLHMVGFTSLSSIGLGLVQAGRSAVLAYTTPLWVVPGAALFLGERLTRRRLLGVAIGLTGLVVLFNPAALDWRQPAIVLGNAAILAAALLWAGSILHIRGHRWRSTPFDLLPWEMLLATLMLLPLAWIVSGPPAFEWTPRLAALFGYAGLSSTIRGDHVARAARNASGQRRSGNALARRATRRVAAGGDTPHPRRSRAGDVLRAALTRGRAVARTAGPA
jgi:drug/metabolite transporter (DMT)-like permease